MKLASSDIQDGGHGQHLAVSLLQLPGQPTSTERANQEISPSLYKLAEQLSVIIDGRI